jgi:hypothetical protein
MNNNKSPTAAANLIGEMLGIKSVPIEFAIDGKRRSVRLKDTLDTRGSN